MYATSDWELDARWSPDGKRLSFSRMPPGADWRHSAVYTVAVDGGDARRLGDGRDARWSPDGKQILFTSNRKGASQIFVMNVDRTHLRNLSGNRRNEYDPSWR